MQGHARIKGEKFLYSDTELGNRQTKNIIVKRFCTNKNICLP